MLGPGGVGGDERQVDVGLHGGGQLALGLLGRLLQALCRAILSPLRSMPWAFLNSSTSQSMTFWSKSSPPRWVSPWSGPRTRPRPAPNQAAEARAAGPTTGNAIVARFRQVFERRGQDGCRGRDLVVRAGRSHDSLLSRSSVGRAAGGLVRPDHPKPGSTTALLHLNVIGLGATLTPKESGTLFLKVNDRAAELDDNAGQLKAEIQPVMNLVGRCYNRLVAEETHAKAQRRKDGDGRDTTSTAGCLASLRLCVKFQRRATKRRR